MREQEEITLYFLPESQGCDTGIWWCIFWAFFRKWQSVDPSSVPSVLIRYLKGGPQLCCRQASEKEILVYLVWVHLKAEFSHGLEYHGTTHDFMGLPISPGGVAGPYSKVCLPLLLLLAFSP